MIDDQNQLQFSRLQGKKNSVLEEISELYVKSQMDATTKPSIDDVTSRTKPEN
jgi:dephospho-CoA kinase